MSQNYFNPYQAQAAYPAQNPNAVNINIISPQAYGAGSGASCPVNPNGFYSLYQPNNQLNMPIYPYNYNNLGYPHMASANPNGNSLMNQNPQILPVAPSEQNPQAQGVNNEGLDSMNRNMNQSTNLVSKTDNTEQNQTEKTDEKEKTKKVVPLTDNYIKSLENYMNDQNPKIRLIGAKELLERFKEDENRKDNPSLMPLLNKALKDTSPSVRFLGLTTLQLGYALGNDETVGILKEIQSQNKDKIGEEALLASEILLNMVEPHKVDVPMTQGEIEKAKKAEKKDKK